MVCKNHNYIRNHMLKNIKYLKNFLIDWKNNIASCLLSDKKEADWKKFLIYEKDNYKFKKGLNVCASNKDGVIVAQNTKKDFPNTGLIDINEKIIMSFEYYDIFPFNAHVKGNLALVTSENLKLGLINSDGKSCIFNEIEQVKKGHILVSFNGTSKQIDLKI